MAPFGRREAEEQRQHPLLGEEAHVVAETRLDGSRVLVVDDEPDANESLSVLLSSLGAEVSVAASVAQALEILDRWLPDVIVSDIGMPGEDGYA
jgi:CheY-like chemotaxis protein